MTLTKTVCPYCGVGCGVLAGPDGTIKGDPDHPANFGRLCSKGAALGETIDLEGRLLSPQVSGKEAGWDETLDLVAHHFNTAIREHGPDSVAFYLSGQMLTEDYYLANKLMKGYIGTANVDTNSRLCMASSVAGHKRAFGTDTVPGTYEDLEQADLIVLVGSNLAWCHPVLHQRIAAAKADRPHMRIVNIDPRKTATTDLADIHLRVAKDGDIALFNGLLAHLADTGSLNADYLRDHVEGGLPAITQARLDDPAQSGLTPQELTEFYQLWAGTEKVVTIYSQGVNQSECGSDKVNAILNCHLATGRIGKPGCGPFSVTGQVNAMGGREVGGMANMLANHLDIENPDHRERVQGFWASPTMSTQPGLKAVDMFQACADGKIKALWVISTNPAVSLPDSDGVAEAIKKVPFVVVSDITANTDTCDLANVLLPATAWGEKDGTVTNSERRISRQRAFLPAPGNTRPDWKIICDVAKRMGWHDGFNFETPAEVFAEYVALSNAATDFGRDLDLSIFTDVDYANLIPTQWPQNGKRFFADGRFYHADGKARMLPVSAPTQKTEESLILNTGRNRDQWHTMTRTGKAPRLGAHLAEPYAEIHPQDAAALGVNANELIELSNTKGSSILRVLITDRAAKRQIFAPMHWTRQQTSGAWVNNLAAPVVDPISGQPAAKANKVTARKFDAKWYAYAAATQPMHPDCPYSAIARTLTGWQGEFAGVDTPENWVDLARGVMNIEQSDVSEVRDCNGQQTRLAFYRNSQLIGLFFTSPEPVSLSRSHAISLIGTDTPPLLALAGRSGADQPDPGATICACLNVGVNTVRQAIAEGANSVDALGAATCAGTNCGSCKPELARLLSQTHLPMAAE